MERANGTTVESSNRMRLEAVVRSRYKRCDREMFEGAFQLKATAELTLRRRWVRDKVGRVVRDDRGSSYQALKDRRLTSVTE